KPQFITIAIGKEPNSKEVWPHKTFVMKKIIIVLSTLIAISSCAQKAPAIKSVPDELITNDSTYWMISTVSSVGYVNTTNGPNYNSYKSGGGMIVKFKFKENGRFEFLLYVQANTYGMDNEAWT